MKTLIVAATLLELDHFIEYYNLPKAEFIETNHFDVLITGVGMVATAFALGKNLNSYNCILNVGIAGSFDRNIKLGELVEVIEDTIADFGAESGRDFISIDELGFAKSNFYAKHNFNINLPQAKGITVNKVTGSDVSAVKLLEQYQAKTESMEGASVFYAANQMNIDCLQVRSISNYIEQRNRENWELGLAIKNLNNWLIDFVGYLK